MNDDGTEFTTVHLQELRRGTVVLACLVGLRNPSYGYALLDELSDHGIEVDANTLYPLLRRLERQGLLTSEWNTDESRPRKFYSTSEAGVLLAEALTREWTRLDAAIRGFSGVLACDDTQTARATTSSGGLPGLLAGATSTTRPFQGDDS